MTHRFGILLEKGTAEIRETQRHFMGHIVCHTMDNFLFLSETEQ